MSITSFIGIHTMLYIFKNRGPSCLNFTAQMVQNNEKEICIFSVMKDCCKQGHNANILPLATDKRIFNLTKIKLDMQFSLLQSCMDLEYFEDSSFEFM